MPTAGRTATITRHEDQEKQICLRKFEPYQEAPSALFYLNRHFVSNVTVMVDDGKHHVTTHSHDGFMVLFVVSEVDTVVIFIVKYVPHHTFLNLQCMRLNYIAKPATKHTTLQQLATIISLFIYSIFKYAKK
jgi:hypothetical protein